MKAIALKGISGYSVYGFEIIGKWGKPLKADRRDVITLQVSGDRPVRANRWKLIWCAQHGVDVRQVSREYSFRQVNGTILVEMFGDRMSMVRKSLARIVKVKAEDYDYIERYAGVAKRVLLGEVDAHLELFALLNGKRDQYIRYARTSCGGVSERKAIDYTDHAIGKVYHQVLSGTYAIPSPVASIKWHINHQIKSGRKTKQHQYNNHDLSRI